MVFGSVGSTGGLFSLVPFWSGVWLEVGVDSPAMNPRDVLIELLAEVDGRWV